MTARWLLVRFGFTALLLCGSAALSQAQVTFIDVDALSARATNAPPRAQPLHLTIAVLRFQPSGKIGRFNGVLPTNGPVAEVVNALGKQGQVNLLYLGDRDLADTTNVAAHFDSAERRPAFSLNEQANRSLTNREFGLHLQVVVRPTSGEPFELGWNGSFSWSPDLIDAWAGEKYLLFGMRVAKLIKPGLLYSDDDDDDGGRGINIGALFKSKPKATNSVPNLSFLVAEREEVALKGHQLARPQELIITATPAPTQDPKQPEFLYLIQQFNLAD